MTSGGSAAFRVELLIRSSRTRVVTTMRCAPVRRETPIGRKDDRAIGRKASQKPLALPFGSSCIVLSPYRPIVLLAVRRPRREQRGHCRYAREGARLVAGPQPVLFAVGRD